MTILSFSIARYRAFDRKARVDLAPITLVVGNNHAGKTSLCRAPWFMSQPLCNDSASPFPFGDPQGSPPPSLLRLARGLSGFEATLEFLRFGSHFLVTIQATARVEARNQQLIARLSISKNQQIIFDEQDLSWPLARKAIKNAQLDGVHETIEVLGGVRSQAELSYPDQGYMPKSVGFDGEYAAGVLASARHISELNDWSARHLGITYEVERDRVWESFRILVTDDYSRVLLSESGTGTVQVLPVAAAILLLPSLPALYCIEHPELHLHPHAHRAVAELLIRGRQRHPETKFLVETHSDTLILRLRRAIVEQRLKSSDVKIYYVSRGEEGSAATPITLNDRGVPDWWPKGVFAEDQEEFHAMRQLLAMKGER